MPKLVLLSEGFTGRSYELKVESTTVGRVADNAFEIADGSVSSHHAEILLRGNDVIVRDLNSTNGTFIDGKQITGEAPVKPGQVIRLGSIDMRLETDQSSKKQQSFDQTKIIPGGVKLNQTDTSASGTRGFGNTTGFQKKSSGANKLFVIGAAVVGLLLIVVLFFVLFRGAK